MYNTRKFFMNSKVFLILLLSLLPTSTFCAQHSELSNKTIFYGITAGLGFGFASLRFYSYISNQRAQTSKQFDGVRAKISTLESELAQPTRLRPEVIMALARALKEDIDAKNRKKIQKPFRKKKNRNK